MRYMLKTVNNANGKKVFAKEKRTNGFVYLVKSENGEVREVDKEWILEHHSNIVNVGVSNDKIYPVSGNKPKRESSFASKGDFHTYLLSNGLIYGGCRLCLVDNCDCETAKRMKKNKVNTVYCRPLSDMDKVEEFPCKCIKEWYGKDALVCSDCGQIVTKDALVYLEDESICSCGGNLEKI